MYIQLHVIELECVECVGPVGKGITLAFPYSVLLQRGVVMGKGAAVAFSIPLREDFGWLKDPQNKIALWKSPSKCDMIQVSVIKNRLLFSCNPVGYVCILCIGDQVLSRLTHIRVLGDWTGMYENVGLDNFIISNTRGQLPACAISKPDASVCNCTPDNK